MKMEVGQLNEVNDSTDNSFIHRMMNTITTMILNPVRTIKYTFLKLFSVPTPWLVNSIPIFGGRTLFELFVMAGSAAVVISLGIQLGGLKAGVITDSVFAVLILFGLRHNILNILFGLSFERALFFHKILLFLGLASATVHGVALGPRLSGFVMVALIMFAGLTYLIKNTFFELFYFLHMATYITIIPIAVGHGAFYFPLAGKE
jgi:hypothetical protein